ncbi:MAG TPA: colanic acid biosynthesis glycosyltransferase WcaI [Leeuwenhoekiella sp.]|nr:colanic acid biosynthesis glycosyltransferase WcaI [Leeuwenhoekiella sp.]
MSKRILLIGYNYSPEPTGIGKYSGEMIQWLAKAGHNCSVITTYPYYPYWEVQEPYVKNKYSYLKEHKTFDSGGEITIYRCPIYVPSKPTGLKRMLLDLSFFLSAFLKLVTLLFSKKFQTVICVAPSFQVGFLGIFYKYMRRAKFVYHIQDLQIEAAQDLEIIKSKKVIRILFSLEEYILNKADIISSISETMVLKIGEKAKKRVYLFPNWADTSLFYPIMDTMNLKTDFGFRKEDIIFLYSGGIGEKQGLESIIYAANKFRDNGLVKFIICGTGPYKEKLISLVRENQLDNIIFMPLQPMEKFNAFLNMADIHLVIQKSKASDLVMPSKLTTILAVGGVALITANKGSGLYALVSKYKMGILVKSEDQAALNEGIETILDNLEKDKVKESARLYAETHLSIENIMQSFEEKILI